MAVWKTTGVPAVKVRCTLTTDKGEATVRTKGALPERPEPLGE